MMIAIITTIISPFNAYQLQISATITAQSMPFQTLRDARTLLHCVQQAAAREEHMRLAKKQYS